MPFRNRGGDFIKDLKERTMKLFSQRFGIDVRENLLVLTLLQKAFKGIRVVDCSLHPLPLEEQKEEREAQILNLLHGFIVKHHISKNHISLSIPREKVLIRFLRLPVATKEDLRKVLEYSTSKYTPFEREEVYFDYHLFDEEKDWLSLMAIYAKKSDIDPYLSLLKKIGIKPDSIQPLSTAAINLFLYHKRRGEKEVSILLDVNESSFEMNLLEGMDWKESLLIPITSEDKTSTFLGALKRLGMEPSLLARTTCFVYGLEMSEPFLSALKELNGFKGVSTPPVGRMKIPDRVNPSKIYPSLGVPLREIARPRVDLNLLPLEMRKKVRRVGKPILISLISLAILISVILGMKIFLQYKEEWISVTEEIKKKKPEVEAIEKLQKQQEAFAKEISELEKIRSEEISKIEILKELTRLLPPTVWLWNLKYNGKEIEISGFADSASDLISILDQSPLFDKVEFLAPVTKERQIKPGSELQEKERFRIRARIESRRVGS